MQPVFVPVGRHQEIHSLETIMQLFFLLRSLGPCCFRICLILVFARTEAEWLKVHIIHFDMMRMLVTSEKEHLVRSICLFSRIMRYDKIRQLLLLLRKIDLGGKWIIGNYFSDNDPRLFS